MATYTPPTLIANGDIVRVTCLGSQKVQIDTFTTMPRSAGGVAFNL